MRWQCVDQNREEPPQEAEELPRVPRRPNLAWLFVRIVAPRPAQICPANTIGGQATNGIRRPFREATQNVREKGRFLDWVPARIGASRGGGMWRAHGDERLATTRTAAGDLA